MPQNYLCPRCGFNLSTLVISSFPFDKFVAGVARPLEEKRPVCPNCDLEIPKVEFGYKGMSNPSIGFLFQNNQNGGYNAAAA